MKATTMTTQTDTNPVNTEYQQAMELHYQILASGEAAAAALISLFQNLKRMRDEQLYIHLGVDSFMEYLEQKLNIERRQAYTYLNVLDNLQPHLLQSNAQLGITKLALLTQVPALDRDDFLEENDLEGMSVKEIQDLVQQVKQQGQQLSLLQDENEKLKDSNTDLTHQLDQLEEESTVNWDESKLYSDLEGKNQTIQQLQDELDALRSQPPATTQEPDEETLARIRQEAIASMEAQTEKDIAFIKQQAENANRTALDQAKREADRAIQSAKEQAADAARQEAEKQFQNSLSTLETEKSQAMERALALEKELKAAGDNDTIRLSVFSDELQAAFGKIAGLVTEKRFSDADTADKYKSAVLRLMKVLCNQAEGL